MSRNVDNASITSSSASSSGDESPVTKLGRAAGSPFVLKTQDVEVLAQSDGFAILQNHLAQTYSYGLCKNHTREELSDLSPTLLTRDVLHALLVPVVELFDKAVTLATYATHATKVEDLEYAFSGHGRSAFLWLQCFLSNEKERDWCYTKGCPACVIEHSLNSEFSVRLLYAACLLSDVHYPFTLDGPKLPSFRFFLESLETALAKDPLYGDEFFERMQSKAVATRNGIEELIHQCIELELEISQPPSPSGLESGESSASASAHSSPIIGPLGSSSSSSSKYGMRIKRGRVARRQMSLQIEEEHWMEEMLRRCWDRLQPPEMVSQASAAPRPVDNKMKTGPVVSVDEVPVAG